MNILRMRLWSPYAVGAGIGVLSWFGFWSADHPIGVSTAVVRVVGMAEKATVSAHYSANAYLSNLKPLVDWELMLVLGLALGAFVSSRLSGDHTAEKVPPLWQRRFGPSVVKRYAWAFVGGMVLLFGARLAGGCTSGHGISGSLQLAVSSWVFFFSIFASGALTAYLLFARGGRNV